MYRVMLIDDEISARKLMAASIDWESLDMCIAGEAGSGIEAINVIDDIKPDLAFVDISMPFMNGIEFTEIATKRYPNLIIIIMTAHDQFEYARKCVSLPVFEYMLKPIVRVEVMETLLRVKEKLDKQIKTDNEDFEDLYIEDSVIEQIKDYIRQNYADSQLNQAAVAQIFGFNSSYLSRKFKLETGKKFIDFLTECRMEKAMELAKKRQKMFCTSTEVGIPDPNYFGRCFKKYAGMSYSEYVSSLDNKE